MSKYPNLIEAGLKVGDTVDGIFGELIVVEINRENYYPIKAEAESTIFGFTATGLNNESHARPAIWFKSDTDWFNPPMSPPEPDHAKEFYTDRPVWVMMHDDGAWYARYAGVFIPDAKYKFWAFNSKKSKSNGCSMTGWARVRYTKPEGAEDHE